MGASWAADDPGIGKILFVHFVHLCGEVSSGERSSERDFAGLQRGRSRIRSHASSFPSSLHYVVKEKNSGSHENIESDILDLQVIHKS
jgi:hypothetical protein